MAREEQRYDLPHCSLRFFPQRGVVVVRDRMADHGERIAVQAVYLPHRLRGAREAVGDDRNRRNSEPLRFNGVVQTARRAAASIADR